MTAKKTASKSPAKRPAKRPAKPSAVADFKKKAEESRDRDLLELPSGNWMECDRTNVMSSFVGGGFVPNSLMSIVQKHIEEGSEMKPEEAAELAQEPDQMKALFEMTDRLIIQIAQEPKVYPLPTKKGEKKVSTRLYVDELNDTDKMFLFQWGTGGTKDLETFRRESRSDMASLLGGEAAGAASKRTGGSGRR